MPLPQMLQHTDERVHASVRARRRLGGKNADGKTAYASAALKDWEMQRNDDSVSWVYAGKGADDKPRVMPEDELGEFELKLMETIDPSARDVLFGFTQALSYKKQVGGWIRNEKEKSVSIISYFVSAYDGTYGLLRR